MSHAREDEEAVILNDGKILVIGGSDDTEVLRSCEIYDPVNESWAEADSLIIPRARFRAFVLPSGIVFVAGGVTSLGTSTTATSELYNPESNKWETGPSMLANRELYDACLLPNNSVFIAGGLDANVASYPLQAEIYDLATNSLSAIKPALCPHYGTQASYLASVNSVVIPGGLQLGFGGLHLKSTQVYSLATQQWSLADSMIEGVDARYSASINSHTGELLVFGGGVDYDNHQTSLVQAFNPVSGHWRKAGLIDSAWGHHICAVGDSVLITGGVHKDPLVRSEWYDVATERTIKGSPLLEPLVNHALITTTRHSIDLNRTSTKIYAFGGRNSYPNGVHNRCEVLELSGSARIRAAVLTDPSQWFDVKRDKDKLVVTILSSASNARLMCADILGRVKFDSNLTLVEHSSTTSIPLSALGAFIAVRCESGGRTASKTFAITW